MLTFEEAGASGELSVLTECQCGHWLLVCVCPGFATYQLEFSAETEWGHPPNLHLPLLYL